MGTNYYRVRKREEINQDLANLANSPALNTSALMLKLREISDEEVHLGKRSSGWKFCWNHNNWDYFETKEDMEEFILSGTIYDEYYEEIDPKEFLEMAYNWCPDGYSVDEDYYKKEYDEKGKSRPYFIGPDNYDESHFGLRFCRVTEFS